jgi:hypothetical protein
MQLLRALARASTRRLADRLNGIHGLFQDLGVVDVGRAVWIIESGMPPRSTTTWRFEPDLPLSVGFGPVLWPPRGRPHSLSPKTPSPSRCGRLLPNDPGACGAAAPTHPPHAIP